MANHKKQFCPKGHDTFVCGRYKSGACIQCGIERGRIDPTKDSRRTRFCPKGHDKDVVGRTPLGKCKKCIADYQKKWRAEHKEELKKKNEEWRKKNEQRIKEVQRTYRETHKEEIKQKLVENPELREKKNAYLRQYHQEHKVQAAAANKKWRDEHKQECLEYKRKYRQEHPEVHRKSNAKSEKKQLKTNIEFKIRKYLRNRINDAIRHNFKSGSAVRDLGCTIEEFKKYIESKFIDGMTWENWGKVWELDHIQELHMFDLTDPIQFKQAVHYTNLQPLTIPDHKKKSAKNKPTK